MELKRNTTYGFSADCFGTELEEDEHLKIKEHTYYLHDWETDWESDEESRKFLVGKCEVREMEVADVNVDTMCYWADEDSSSFVSGLEEYTSKNKSIANWLTKVVFISELQIKKKYQNKGYGTSFLKGIMKDLRGYNGDVLFLLEACPFNKRMKEEKREKYIKKNSAKLKRFYRKLGYKPVSKKSSYMARYIEELDNVE